MPGRLGRAKPAIHLALPNRSPRRQAQAHLEQPQPRSQAATHTENRQQGLNCPKGTSLCATCATCKQTTSARVHGRPRQSQAHLKTSQPSPASQSQPKSAAQNPAAAVAQIACMAHSPSTMEATPCQRACLLALTGPTRLPMPQGSHSGRGNIAADPTPAGSPRSGPPLTGARLAASRAGRGLRAYTAPSQAPNMSQGTEGRLLRCARGTAGSCSASRPGSVSRLAGW